jgi:hypothetical protein
MNFRLVFTTVFLGLVLVPRAQPYVVEPEPWTSDRTVVMQLSLGGPQPLLDGFGSFNESARDALNMWNVYLTHLRFGVVMNSPVPVKGNDDQMSVVFSSTVNGKAFGSGVLAVTLLYSRDPGVREETDTYFNTGYQWDSYRGALKSMEDFHRVAIHEFGHTLGLDHPDQSGQKVTAVMNSTISNTDSLQSDDIAGAHALDTGPAIQSSVNASVLQNISTRGFVGTGENVLIGGFIVQGNQPATVIVRGIGYSLSAFGITTALSDPVITIFNSSGQQVKTSDDWFTSADAATIASYRLDPPNSIESALIVTLNPGSYTAVVQGYADQDTPASIGVGLFELYDLHTTGGRAGNVSTRGQVGAGGSVLIGGFIIGGSQSKQVILRALGPSLASLGINGALGDPTLELHDANGGTLQTNNDWQQSPDAATISSKGFAPSDGRESALMATLNPGSYTAIVQGAGGLTGIGLVEVYDLSP